MSVIMFFSIVFNDTDAITIFVFYDANIIIFLTNNSLLCEVLVFFSDYVACFYKSKKPRLAPLCRSGP